MFGINYNMFDYNMFDYLLIGIFGFYIVYKYSHYSYEKFKNIRNMNISIPLNTNNSHILCKKPISVVFYDFLPVNIFENIKDEYDTISKKCNEKCNDIDSDLLVNNDSTITKIFHSKNIQNTITRWVQLKLGVVEQFRLASIYDPKNNFITTNSLEWFRSKNNYKGKIFIGLYIIKNNIKICDKNKLLFSQHLTDDGNNTCLNIVENSFIIFEAFDFQASYLHYDNCEIGEFAVYQMILTSKDKQLFLW